MFMTQVLQQPQEHTNSNVGVNTDIFPYRLDMIRDEQRRSGMSKDDQG